MSDIIILVACIIVVFALFHYFSIVPVRSVPIIKLNWSPYEDGSLAYRPSGKDVRIPKSEIGPRVVEHLGRKMYSFYAIYFYDPSKSEEYSESHAKRVFLLRIFDIPLDVRSMEYKTVTYDYPCFVSYKGKLHFYDRNEEVPVGAKQNAIVYVEYSRSEYERMKGLFARQLY